MSQKEGSGIVVSNSGNISKIKVNRHGDCSNCGACSSDNVTFVEALNTLNSKPGDRVSFEIKEENMLKYAFVIYALPLVATIAGFGLGTIISTQIHQYENSFQVGGSVLGFIIAALYIKYFNKKIEAIQKKLPSITKIL